MVLTISYKKAMDSIRKMIDYRLDEYNNILIENFEHQILDFVEHIWNSFRQGGKLLVCGNGGSAADSLHFVAELVGRFRLSRKPISAISLNSDVATITAISNDFNYNDIFSRQVEALADKNDSLIVISTSGNSQNIVEAAHMAKKNGINVLALLGGDGGKVSSYITHGIIVPCLDTAIVQEIHQIVIHIICEVFEDKLVHE